MRAVDEFSWGAREANTIGWQRVACETSQGQIIGMINALLVFLTFSITLQKMHVVALELFPRYVHMTPLCRS